MTDNIYLSSIYRLTGLNFWESAKKLDSIMEKTADGLPVKITAIPFYFLTSHAIELFLKSALLKRGLTEQELKKYDYRHNLNAFLEKIQKVGVTVQPKTIEVIRGLHSQHISHALRYTALVDDGQKTYLPPPALINSVLDELLLLTRISTQGK